MTKRPRARPRVLALHGISATPALWDDVSHEAPHFEWIAPDLSVLLQAVGARLGSLVRALSAVVGTGPVALVGCGVGANVALELAAALGDRARGLLLLNPQPLRPQPAQRERYRQLARLVQHRMSDDELLAWAAMYVRRRGPRAEKAVPQAEAMLVSTSRSSVPLLRLVADFPDGADALGRVRAPVRAVFGEDHLNPFAGPGWIDEWRRALGPENVELLPETRQWLPLEAPDAVAEALVSLLDGGNAARSEGK